MKNGSEDEVKYGIEIKEKNERGIIETVGIFRDKYVLSDVEIKGIKGIYEKMTSSSDKNAQVDQIAIEMKLCEGLITEAIINFVTPGVWFFSQSIDGSPTITCPEREAYSAIFFHAFYTNKYRYNYDGIKISFNKPFASDLYYSGKGGYDDWQEEVVRDVGQNPSRIYYEGKDRVIIWKVYNIFTKKFEIFEHNNEE